MPAIFSVSVTAGGAAVRSATIEFGDGGKQSVSTSGLSTVTHVYTESGTFIVTAEAIDTAGESATATASVSVQSVVVNVTLSWSPATITTNVPADFAATVTTNPAGVPIRRYEWDSSTASWSRRRQGTTLSYHTASRLARTMSGCESRRRAGRPARRSGTLLSCNRSSRLWA